MVTPLAQKNAKQNVNAGNKNPAIEYLYSTATTFRYHSDTGYDWALHYKNHVYR